MRKVKREQRYRKRIDWQQCLSLATRFKSGESVEFELFSTLRSFAKRWHRQGKASECAAKMFGGITGRGLTAIHSTSFRNAYSQRLNPVNGKLYSNQWEPDGRRYYFKSDVIAILREQVKARRWRQRVCWICKRREKKWHLKTEEFHQPYKRRPSRREVSTWNGEVTAPPWSQRRHRFPGVVLDVDTCGDECYATAESILWKGWIHTQRLDALRYAREVKRIAFLKQEIIRLEGGWKSIRSVRKCFTQQSLELKLLEIKHQQQLKKEKEWLKIGNQKITEIRKWLKNPNYQEAQR